ELEAVPREARGDVHALGDLSDRRVPVGRDVVEPGPRAAPVAAGEVGDARRDRSGVGVERLRLREIREAVGVDGALDVPRIERADLDDAVRGRTDVEAERREVRDRRGSGL